MTQTKIVFRQSLNPIGQSFEQKQKLLNMKSMFRKLDETIGETVYSINRLRLNKYSRSLNVSDKQTRVNQLEAMCIERQKGLGELFTPEEINAFIEKPITKSERLRMYNNNGRYLNNKRPKIK